MGGDEKFAVKIEGTDLLGNNKVTGLVRKQYYSASITIACKRHSRL